MRGDPLTIRVKLSRDKSFAFKGVCLARVCALNHDNSVRRQFSVYSNCDGGYVAERIDDPGSIDVRHWGACCNDSLSIYEFFGNEPLANYLYGSLNFNVPGLHRIDGV